MALTEIPAMDPSTVATSLSPAEKNHPSDSVSIEYDSPKTNGEKPQGEILTSDEHSDNSVKAEAQEKENDKYITGLKLIIVISSVTLVAFLLFIDLSIVSTVSLASMTRIKGNSQTHTV